VISNILKSLVLYASICILLKPMPLYYSTTRNEIRNGISFMFLLIQISKY